MSVGPAAVPGIVPDTTMFAALHGDLTAHPRRDRSAIDADAYKLFLARASTMGWLTDPAGGTSGDLWGMNDAGQDPDSGSQPPRAAWFHVSLNEPVSAKRPLPVQPFLSCAGAAVGRLGTLDLRAVQMLLPVQSLREPAGTLSRESPLMTLVRDAGWFAACDPHQRTPVRVTLDSGQDPSIRSAAPAMLPWMQQLNQDVFSPESFSLSGDDDLVLKPAVVDELWGGPGHYRATFHGTLAEWSLDALAWMAAFLADASFGHGVDTPLMLAASPS